MTAFMNKWINKRRYERRKKNGTKEEYSERQKRKKKNWQSTRTERTTINETLYTRISTDKTEREREREMTGKKRRKKEEEKKFFCVVVVALVISQIRF